MVAAKVEKVLFVIGVLDERVRVTEEGCNAADYAMLNDICTDLGVTGQVCYAVENLVCAGRPAKASMKLVREERDRLLAEIADNSPDLVIALGPVAIKALFNKGNLKLDDLRRTAHTIEGIDCPVHVTHGLDRCHAQHGIRPWIAMDTVAAVMGFTTTEWGDYEILLPSDPAWGICPAEFTNFAPGDFLGLDLETYPGTDEFHSDARIRMCVVSREVGRATVVQAKPDSSFPNWLTRLASDSSLCKCGSYIAFDYRWLRRFGVRMRNMWDTCVAEHILDENNPLKGLKDLTLRYLSRLGDYSAEHRALVEERGGWEHVTDEEMHVYCGADGEASVAAAQGQAIRLGSVTAADPQFSAWTAQSEYKQPDIPNGQHNLPVATKLSMDLYPVLSEMSAIGMRIDTRENKRLDAAFSKHLNELRKEIIEVLGPINPASPKQLIDALYKEIPGIDLKKYDFKKQYNGVRDEDEEEEFSTNKAILKREARKHPIIATVLEFRKYSKLHGTYIKSVADKHLREHNGYAFIHPSFNQNRVNTNRLSSSNPNGQNIPRKPDEGEDPDLNIKLQFTSRFPGGVILEADQSQAELRTAAWLSQDPKMLEAVNSGEDIHTRMAATMLDKLPEDVTKAERQRCKSLTFLILYGGGANTLSVELDISKPAAKRLIKEYFEAFPVLNRYIQRTHYLVQRQLYVDSPFGYRRRFEAPPNHNWNQWDGWKIQRQAWNHMVQNTAACITYCAMIDIDKELHKRGLKSVMINQVHDSVMFDVYPGELDELAKLVKDCMEHPNTQAYGVDITVPLVCDVEIGDSWGTKREYQTKEG